MHPQAPQYPQTVLHVPHASRSLPPQWRGFLALDDAALALEVLRMTDSFTDELYQLDGAVRVEFPVSRLILDPERFEDDACEPMSKRGMGVIYTATSHNETLRPPPSPEEREALLDAWYRPHHARLTQAVDGVLEAHGRCLLIDCHSFPRTALPYERQPADKPRAEIVIGTDPFHTPSSLVPLLTGSFEERGYSTAVNDPFGGALTPLKHYGRDKRVAAFMIEVRRDLYMDEVRDGKTGRFGRVQADLTRAMQTAAEAFARENLQG